MEFRCHNCGEIFLADVKNKEKRKEVRCPKCKSKIVRFAGAGKEDDADIKGNEIALPTKFECKKCGYAFFSKDDLDESCPRCDRKLRKIEYYS